MDFITLIKMSGGTDGPRGLLARLTAVPVFRREVVYAGLCPLATKKCELACRPVGYTFYQGVGRNATNGTSCGSDGSVCVDGVCKTVGCDEVIDSNATIDRCGVCGGDGMSCQTVIKTFTDSVKFGYKTIGIIPAGSSNIKISEIEESRNYLALKTTDGSFKLNTDWRLSRFGEHPGVGTVFNYNRNKGADCPGECIEANGPTDVDIEVVGLFYTKKGAIRYSFTVPADSSNIVLEDDIERYEGPIFSHDFTFKRKKAGHKNSIHLKHIVHNKINRHEKRDDLKESAYYGTRTKKEAKRVNSEISENEVNKKDDYSGRNSSEKTNISHSKNTIGELKSKDNREEPGVEEDDFEDGIYLNEAMAKESGEVSSEDSDEDPAHRDAVADNKFKKDNTIPSLYSWRIRGYTQCSTSCGEGKHSQILECIVTNKATAVTELYCADEPKPVSQVKPCSYGPCPPTWQPQPWSKCSVTCGSGSQRRNFVCTTPDGKEVSRRECSSSQPRSEERTCDVGSCNMGWYHTQWPNECPVSCGDGVMSRKIYCASGSSDPMEVCLEKSKPQTEKRCKGDVCGASWFTGPWSECNATCGVAHQNRAVVCILRQRRGRTMVVGDSYCTGEEKPTTYMSCDLELCGPEWYMNEWNRCSASCGDGQKSRDVKCLDINKRPSEDCDPATMPREKASCNERKCPQIGSGRHQPTDSDCVDKFSSCHMVIQARLCQYKYYTKICCKSCQNLNT